MDTKAIVNSLIERVRQAADTSRQVVVFATVNGHAQVPAVVVQKPPQSVSTRR